jgi:flagellar hook-basal body complex protein FliE
MDFGDLLKSAMTDAAHASKAAETKMANQVPARPNWSTWSPPSPRPRASLETVMAVRDQVISAYQEIMRMPI